MAVWKVSTNIPKSVVERQIWTNRNNGHIVKEFFYTNGSYLVSTEDQNKPLLNRDERFSDSGDLVDGGAGIGPNTASGTHCGYLALSGLNSLSSASVGLRGPSKLALRSLLVK